MTLRQHLEGEERRLFDAIKPLRAQLEPIEAELADVQRALRAIGALAHDDRGLAKARPGPSKHTSMRAERGVNTLTDVIKGVLQDNRSGLTSVEIHKLCEKRLDRKVRDENVRGQLSRLKKQGFSAWYDGLWYAFDDAPTSLGVAHR